MKIYCVSLVAILALGLGGCAALDWMAGVNPDGTRKDGASPAGVVGAVVNYAIPGGGAVLGGLTTLWAALRARAWKTAFAATAGVIEAGAEAGKSVQAIKAELGVAHSAAGVGGIVKTVIDKLP